MKLALFHLGFFYSGGGEKLVLEEMRGLRALGHQVDCFAPYVDRQGCFPDIPEMAEIQPLLPPPPSWLPMKDPLWVTFTCLLIPFLAGRFRSYDVFLGANQPGPWLAFVLGQLLRKPYVIYLAQPMRILYPRRVDLENGLRIREGDHHFLMALAHTAGWFIGWADKLSVRQAQVVLTNGEYVSQWIRQVYGVENRVCAAGCHPLPPSELDYTQRWQGELSLTRHIIHKPYILLTNRHSPMKHFEYAIQALQAIRTEAPTKRVSLVITGQETEYTHHLRQLVVNLGMENAVNFVGLVTEQELARLYREAAVYVYPSPEEDFGMGIVEAMAAGVPVVAWNNGGPTGTVKHNETGFLIEPYDTADFAAKLLSLVQQPALAERLGRAGNRRAHELFSYERHHQTLAETLAEAIRAYHSHSVSQPQPIEVQGAHWVQK
jgi:glycosyltransferase involved in cell wall biosynthesis